ncbi:MAG: RagB/SusD family nutrient uptake outer membrane protein [Gemmatimonadetes bacterium]|nr:RagB/SusD family nutrient uptake outer membrane protein [Gemmatimonadota bacterium]
MKIKTMLTSCMTRRVALLPAALIGLVAACDTDVVNPGRVQEVFLFETEAQEAIVSGIGRAVAEAQNYVGYTGAAVSREIHPSGSTGSFGITVEWQNGELDYETVNTHWNLSQRARWWGDDGIAKIMETGAENQATLAEAYLWTGYAHRLLGENFCLSVIDGGSAGDRSVYYDRAIARFDQAASLGSGDMAMAAVAARASVKAFMGDWSGAASDAAGIPDGFVFNLPYFGTEGDATRNRIQFASQAEPYKAHTQRYTKYEDYSMSENNPEGDPRVGYRVTDETGDAAVLCCGQVPWWPQTKYADSGSDIPLSKGTEMRLIEAESMLVSGDWQGAMGKINALRTAAGVEPAMATNTVEAWTALKFERGVVLWLEGRRLGDFYRWNANNTPGELHALETPSGSQDEGSHLVQQDLCFPISRGEVDTNPNISGPTG